MNQRDRDRHRGPAGSWWPRNLQQGGQGSRHPAEDRIQALGFITDRVQVRQPRGELFGILGMAHSGKLGP